jgi:hypothetical protein
LCGRARTNARGSRVLRQQAAEPVVQANPHDTARVTSIDQDIDRDATGVGTGVAAVGAEVEIHVLGLGRPVRRETELKAGADRLPARCLAADRRRHEALEYIGDDAEFDVARGVATFHVGQRAVPSVTDLAGDGAERAEVGLAGEDETYEGEAGDFRAGLGALGIGRAKIAFHAQHHRADLIIEADLAAAKKAGIVRIDGGGGDSGGPGIGLLDTI